jgi:small subunit ribosomal protein S4e
MANSRHLKRNSMPTSWPVQRKTITFIGRPKSGSHKRDYVVSALILLRDVLKYTHTTKEAKYVVNEQEFLVNGRKITDVKSPVGLFDIVEIPAMKEKFVVLLNEVGRVKLVASKDQVVTLKVSNKTKAKAGKLQLNFMNGYNVLVDEKTFKSVSVNDSVEYDFTKKSIVKSLPLKEGSSVYVFDGKYQGSLGVVKSFVNYNGITRDIVEIEINGTVQKTVKDYCYVVADTKRFA